MPDDAINKEIRFPQGNLVNADGTEAASERLAWKEAVLAAIEGAYPSQTASNPVPPSPVSVGGLSAGAGAADHAGALKTAVLSHSCCLRDRRRMCSTSERGRVRREAAAALGASCSVCCSAGARVKIATEIG